MFEDRTNSKSYLGPDNKICSWKPRNQVFEFDLNQLTLTSLCVENDEMLIQHRFVVISVRDTQTVPPSKPLVPDDGEGSGITQNSLDSDAQKTAGNSRSRTMVSVSCIPRRLKPSIKHRQCHR